MKSASQPTLLERAIAYLAPTRAVRRASARAQLSLFQEFNARRESFGYGGASRSKRLGFWRSPSTSANVEVGGALSVLRNRTRDLVRNNSYAARAVRVVNTNTVGTGILATARTEKDTQAKVLADLWANWWESKQCDKAGREIGRASCRERVLYTV